MTYDLEISGAYLYINLLENLAYNTLYTIIISAGISGVYDSGVFTLDEDYSFWFTSQYCPLFTTLTRVQLEAGPGAATLVPDTIYRLIHKNSKDAVDIYNAYHNTCFSYDYWGCVPSGVPIIFRRYVECKTAYDILAILELAATGNGIGAGGQLKTLGDLTIRYDSAKSSSVINDPSRKKQLYDCWIEAISAIKYYGIHAAVRGWYDVSKQFPHPTYDVDHNRVVRTVDFKNSNPGGPWRNSSYWRANI